MVAIMKKTSLISLFLLPLLVCGCHVGPRYSSPITEVPVEWKGFSPNEEDTPCVAFWWEVFDDEVLNELEERAVLNNNNVYVALERVIEARAMAGVSRSELYPHLNLAPSYENSGALFKLFVPPGTPETAAQDVFRIHQFQYAIPLNMTYQIDLWGKLCDQYTSAFRTAQAQEEALRTALLTVTTDLAASYYRFRSLDTQVRLLEETVVSYREWLKVTQSRFDQGLVNYLDVSNAALLLANVEADYFDVVRQQSLEENSIAILIGEIPSNFHLARAPLETPPPSVPAGLPSEVLLQRPDIAQAEREMASEHALVSAAYASFYPSLELTGTLGFSSPTLKDFLTWQSRLWDIGADAFWNVFDAGRRQSDLQAAWARFSQAKGTYQQTVLTAFGEVENALSNLEMQAKQYQSLEVSLLAAAKTTQISKERYLRGLSNYLDVINSFNNELVAQRNISTLIGARYLSTIQLIKAIGGSWTREGLLQSTSEEPCCSRECE